MNRFLNRFLPLSFILFSFTAVAQVAQPGIPYFLELDHADRPYLNNYEFSSPGASKIDRHQRNYPDLFALPESVSISPATHGQWQELDNGDRIWWLSIKFEDAAGIAACYRNFYLPPGASLYMFSPEGKQSLGAYTNTNNSTSGFFRTGFIQGDAFILEYREPASYRNKGHFEIFRLDYAYDRHQLAENRILDTGFGTSDPCNININCPEGDEWQDEKNGVCRIQMVLVEGTGWCSGSLVNNVLEDGTPYLLSGFHCQDGYTPLYDLWRFDFNYESSTCSNPVAEPAFNSVLGCQYRAGYQNSDFLLLEISEAIPLNYNVRFNGWDREAVAPDSSAHIHHPNADIMKISLDTQLSVIHPLPINWSNGVTTPPDHHFRIIFDHGTFEPGSSGGPLFNQSGRIVGQLQGGIAGCDQVITYHGRFTVSWDGGGTPESRLKDWLDPNATDQLFVDGIYDPAQGSMGIVSGKILTEWGEGVAGVSVVLSGFVQDTMLTDTSGSYEFQNLPFGEDYTIRPEKDINVDNGVTTLDMLFIQKDILNLDPLDSEIKILAADANHSDGISTLDLVYIQKVILQLDYSFPNNTSWRFVDSDHVFGDPPLIGLPEEILITGLPNSMTDLNFTGAKIGDVNETANPAN